MVRRKRKNRAASRFGIMGWWKQFLLVLLLVIIVGAVFYTLLKNTDNQTHRIAVESPPIPRVDELFEVPWDDNHGPATRATRWKAMADRLYCGLRLLRRGFWDMFPFARSSSANSDQERLKEMQEDIKLKSEDKLMGSTIHSSSRNSDTEKLKGMPEVIKLLSEDKLADCKKELKELMDKIEMPSRAKMMERAIADFMNISSSFEDRSWASNKLLILLEAIDDAYNFEKLGGLTAVIQALNGSREELRSVSAWLLGKACQINPNFQRQILELDALPNLMTMVKSTIVDEAVRALYAVSEIIRNNLDGLEKFYGEYGGAVMLQEIMSNPSADIRLRRRSASLADLAEYHLENSDVQQFLPFSSPRFLKSVVHLIKSSDFYLQRKALMVFKKIIPLLIPSEAAYLKECDLDAALERMRKELDGLVGERGDLGDILLELESLHKDVRLLYQRVTSKDKKGTAPRRTAVAIVKSFQFI